MGGSREDFNVWRHTAGMNLSGRKRMAQGEATTMPGIPDDWRVIPSTTALFDRASEEEFIRRVLVPVKRVAEECGIEMLYATEDFPLHFSLKNGKFPPGEEANEEWHTKAAEVCADAELQNRSRHLEGALSKSPLNFRFVVFDHGAGSVMLAGVEIPPEIQEFRAYAEHLFTKKGIGIRNPDPIAHIAFARLKKLPENPARLQEFARKIVNIRHEISRSGRPISLKTREVFAGQDMVGVTPLRAP